MATNYSPELVTDGAVFVGDAASSLATPALDLDVLIVAGGGGGGYALGGGGGGGGVVHLTNANVSKGTYAVVVGAGGISDENGSNSTIFGATAAGGGGGDGYPDASGNSGGCGGGAGSANSGGGVGGAATGSSLGTRTGTIYGNKGGNQTTARVGNPTSARAGGGAGAAGADEAPSTTDGGTGGAGIQINIDGNNYYWAGGGGGAAYVSYDGGAGGLGGGGGGSSNQTGVGAGGTGGVNNGATPTLSSIGGVAGTNTGSGGGGGAWSSYAGGAGGSGIVIIRLAAKNNLGVATAITTLSGKSYTTYTSGGVSYYVWTYTASGNFTIPHSLLVDRAGGNSGMMYNGSCVDFDGTDAYVTYGDVTWLDGLTTISVCCWLYQDGAPPNSGGVFLSKDNAIECWTKQDTENKYIMSINNNHRSLEGGGTPALGAWVHVVMTWNSTGDVRKLYLNGAYADVDTGGNQSGNSINNTADGLAIGARANGSYEIDGKIADTKVFSKELSASQVKEMYEDSKVIIPSNMPQTALTLWAPLTDGAGTIAYDGSGYGRDGTYTGTGFLSGQTGCPQLVEGYNRPFLFDADGYAYTSLTMNALTDYTFSWWSRSTSPGGNTGLFSSGGSSVGAFHQNWSNNRPLLYLAGNNYRYWVDTPAQDDGQWHHWLITYVGTASGNNQAANSSLYVDGVLISPWSATNSATPTAWGTFSIGRLTGAGTWSGNLNEFIIYNGELSSSERAALYAIDANGGPLPPDPMSLSNSSDVLAYWRNDGNVTWADRSGNGYTGTVGGSPDALLFKQGINGSASTSTGRDGQGFPLKFENNGAIGFTGMLADEGTRITGVDPTAFSYITVSAWVKIVGNTNWGTIAMQADDNSFNAGWGLGFSGTSSTFMWWVDHYNDPATADISSHYGKWLHVVGTYNGTDQKLYFNGVEVDSEADTWTNKGAATNEIHVGTGIGTSNPVFRYGLDGQIGNIQIYNRALRVAEITQNFNAQKSRFT